MSVASPIIQVHFQNAMLLAAEDFYLFLKYMNKVFWESLLAHTNFPKKNLFFLIMLRSGMYSNSFTGKMKNAQLHHTPGRKKKKKKKKPENPTLEGLSESAE